MTIRYSHIKAKSVLHFFLALAFISLISWVIYHYRDHIDPHIIKTTVDSFGAWGPIIFITLYAIAVVCFLPGIALTLTGGLIFGPIFGFTYNLIGASIGMVVAFLVSRYFVSDWVKRRAGPKLNVMMNGIETEGWRFVAIVRLAPIVPFNLLNYMLGVTPLPLRTYIVTSVLGIIPGCAAYTYLGHLGMVAASGEQAKLAENALIALFLLALAAYAPRLIKLLRRKTK